MPSPWQRGPTSCRDRSPGSLALDTSWRQSTFSTSDYEISEHESQGTPDDLGRKAEQEEYDGSSTSDFETVEVEQEEP